MPTINDGAITSAEASNLTMNYTLLGGGNSGGAAGGSNSSGALLSGTQAQEAGGAIGAFGTAIGDFMSIATDKKAAAAYGEAAALAGENINITDTSTKIQKMQAQRQLSMTLGQQSAAIAANGFTQNSGTIPNQASGQMS